MKNKIMLFEEFTGSLNERGQTDVSFEVGDTVMYSAFPGKLHAVTEKTKDGKTKIKPIASGGRQGSMSWESWISNDELEPYTK